MLFRAENLDKAFIYMRGMFAFASGNMVDKNFVFYAAEYWPALLFGFLCATPVFKNIGELLSRKKITGNVYPYISAFVQITLFVLSVSYLIMGTNNPFIYFNF